VVTVFGTASDNVGVSEVEYRLENANGVSDYTNAIGTNAWSATVSGLAPGTNTVRVRARDTSGNLSMEAARSFRFVVVSPLTLLISGSGTVTPNLNGRVLEVGKVYSLTAKPNTGSLFSNWTGGILATTQKLTFLMRTNLSLQANFVLNPFIQVRGTYNGLFFMAGGVNHTNSGSFKITTTDKGAYSALISVGGKKYSASGQLDLDGKATKVIKRTGLAPVTVVWCLNLQGADAVAGTVTATNWHEIATLSGDRALYHATTNPAPQAGTYTLVIPGSPGSTSTPQGDGYGTATVGANGTVKFGGALADGTKISQSVTLSKNGEWPLYAPLYRGRGSVLSWVVFDAIRTNDVLHGLLSWIRPPGPAPKYYTNGFMAESLLTGWGYRNPGTTNRILVLTNGLLVLGGGNLGQVFTNKFILGPNNKVTNDGPNKLELTFTGRSGQFTGLFTGTFMEKGTTKKVTFQGAVLQKPNYGSGFFLGTNQSGSIRLQPAF